MRPELKDVAGAGDRDSAGLGRQRPLLDRLRLVAEHDLVDFVEGEAGDLDRRVVQDQFLEFDLELVEVPLALFAEPVDGEAQQALLVLASNGRCARRARGRAREPRRLEPDLAVEDDIVLPMRMGSQKPSALIEAATSRTWAGSILRTLRAGVRSSSRRDVHKIEIGRASLRGACAGDESAAKRLRLSRRRRPLPFSCSANSVQPRISEASHACHPFIVALPLELSARICQSSALPASVVEFLVARFRRRALRGGSEVGRTRGVRAGASHAAAPLGPGSSRLAATLPNRVNLVIVLAVGK